jgi:hypothetical protein
MFEEIDVISPPSSTSGEGWRLPLVLPSNGRIPFDVETTLPRERQVGESASPRLDADRYFDASAVGFK